MLTDRQGDFGMNARRGAPAVQAVDAPLALAELRGVLEHLALLALLLRHRRLVVLHSQDGTRFRSASSPGAWPTVACTVLGSKAFAVAVSHSDQASVRHQRRATHLMQVMAVCAMRVGNEGGAPASCRTCGTPCTCC